MDPLVQDTVGVTYYWEYVMVLMKASVLMNGDLHEPGFHYFFHGYLFVYQFSHTANNMTSRKDNI